MPGQDKTPYISMNNGILNIDAIDYIKYARRVKGVNIEDEIFLRGGTSVFINRTEMVSLKNFLKTVDIKDY